MRRGAVLAGVLGMAVAVAGAALPASGAGWVPSPPALVVDSPISKDRPSLHISANGDAVVAWTQGSATGTAVLASIRHLGTWGSPAVLDDGPGTNVTPHAVIDANGTATVVWERLTIPASAGQAIKSATRPAGGSWSAAAEISVGSQGENLDVAIAPDGTVVAAWQVSGAIVVADRAAGSPTWTITPLTGYAPSVAAAPDNRLAVVWMPGNNNLLAAKVRSAAGTWGTTEVASEEYATTPWVDAAREPLAGFGADNALHVAFREYQDPTIESPVDQVRFTTRTTGGVWTEHPAPISPAYTITQPEGIAGDAVGNVTVVWSSVHFDPFFSGYGANTRVAGTWEEPISLTGPDSATVTGTPRLLLDDGVFTAIWGQESAVKANRRTAAGDWLASPENVVASPAAAVVAALEPNGDPTALWYRTFFVGGTVFHAVLESKTYDSSVPPGDTTGPVTTMTQPGVPFFLAAQVPIAWTAVDSQSAVASSRVRYRAALWNGDYGGHEFVTTFFAGTSMNYATRAGRTYCFSAQSRDTVPNDGDWSAEKCSAAPVDDRTAVRAGGWTTISAAKYYRSTALRTSNYGATLTLTGAQGKRLGLVVTKCPGCGKVSVKFAGVKLGTWSLAATTVRNRVVIPVKLWPEVHTGKLVVTVVSVSGKKVIVDGILVGRR